jgi:hypothetical protein
VFSGISHDVRLDRQRVRAAFSDAAQSWHLAQQTATFGRIFYFLENRAILEFASKGSDDYIEKL